MDDDLFDKERGDEKQKKSRDLELFTIRQIMKNENGRSFMWRCLQNCCTFENIFSADSAQHAYNAGMRSHGLWLDAELREAGIDDYLKMVKENR